MKASRVVIQLFLTYLMSHLAFGQKMPYDKDKKLQLLIIDTEIKLENGVTEFDINISITNKSDSSFLLYGFKAVESGNSTVDFWTKPKMVGGNALFSFDKNGVYHNIGVRDPQGEIKHFQPVTLDSVANSIKKSGDFLFNKKLVLAKKETQ